MLGPTSPQRCKDFVDSGMLKRDLPEHQEKVQARWEAQLDAFLAPKAEGEQLRASAHFKSVAKAAAEQNAHNTQYCIAVDNAMQAVGLPLRRFVVQSRVGRLAANERRIFIEDTGMPLQGVPADIKRFRSIIEDIGTKSRRYELPRDFSSAGEVCRPAIHLHLDESAIGKPFSFWLATSSGVRATQKNDRSHRVQNDCKAALNASTPVLGVHGELAMIQLPFGAMARRSLLPLGQGFLLRLSCQEQLLVPVVPTVVQPDLSRRRCASGWVWVYRAPG